MWPVLTQSDTQTTIISYAHASGRLAYACPEMLKTYLESDTLHLRNKLLSFI